MHSFFYTFSLSKDYDPVPTRGRMSYRDHHSRVNHDLDKSN